PLNEPSRLSLGSELAAKGGYSAASSRRSHSGESSALSGMSLTDGNFRISGSPIFTHRWTIHERERSSRAASCWMSSSIDSGKYRLCLRLSVPAIRGLLTASSARAFLQATTPEHRQ